MSWCRVAVVVVALAGCASKSGPEGGGVCCPPGMPTCDGTLVGGWAMRESDCESRRVFDAHPDDFRRAVDSHGCGYWQTGSTRSCFRDTDAGPRDAGPRDAGRIDAGPLPPGITRSPDGAGYCCEIGWPSCECTPAGGFAESIEECERLARGVCDAAPPDWHRRTDGHGCDYYEITFTACCNCPDGGPAGAGAR